MTENTNTANVNLEGLSVAAACEAIGYTPEAGFSDKPEKQQRSMIRAKQLEYARREAVGQLGAFVDTDAFRALPEEVKEAIRTIAVKRVGGFAGGSGGGGARNIFMDTISEYLGKKGDMVDELTLFKALKMGRGEIRAKIRENLKKAEPESRMWVVLDETAEAWKLIGIGAKQPKAWTGAPIDEDVVA